MSSSTVSRKGRIQERARRAGLTLALALAALAALPTLASAATVGFSGTTVTYAGASTGESVTVTVSGANYRFTQASGLTAAAGCTQVTAGTVVDCPLNPTLSVLGILNPGADTFNASAVNQDPFGVIGGDDADTIIGSAADDDLNGQNSGDNVSGSAGNDQITGGSDGDTLNGGAGHDVLLGNAGVDDMNGDAGNDRFQGGADGDDYDGGADIDRAVYTVTTFGCSAGDSVQVSLDNSNNDGGCNGDSGNNVRDSIEAVTGTDAGDTITGSCQNNTLAGSGGTANGHTDGNDTLIGDPASCLAAASDGTESDFLGGGEGNDVFNGDGSGNPGIDTVTYGTPYTGQVVSAACAVASVNRAARVTLDDAANDCDGFGNTTDNVNGDINRLIGTPVADSFTGTGTTGPTHADERLELFGRAGTDLLTDGPFDDFLNGEADADTINCTNSFGGGGTDTRVVDAADTHNGPCEVSM